MIKILTPAIAALALFAPPAVAADDYARLDILPGWRTAEGKHMAALRVQLAPGWKTYWRAPGEAGIPPRFDWHASTNIASVVFHWPVPHVFEQNGMRSIGYKGELILPIEITPRDPAQPITMDTEIELGVCLDICMPLLTQVHAALPLGGTPDPAIRAALADRPATAREAGVKSVTCSAEPIRDGLRLTAQIDIPRQNGDETAVFELSDQTIWIAEAMTSRSGKHLISMTEMVPANAAPFMLDRSDVRITVIGAGSAVDIQGCTGG